MTILLHAPLQGSLDLPQARARAPRRVTLDATSWVEHHPRWLEDADTLCQTLAVEARWEQRSRFMVGERVVEPRLTAEYDDLASCPIAALAALGVQLSDLHGTAYDRAWINLYRDERDSTSWHADKPASLQPTSLVPVLSLGETRRLLLRRAAGGASVPFHVEHGDLMVMGGRCQCDWVHAVPKERTARGSRISINFAATLHRDR